MKQLNVYTTHTCPYCKMLKEWLDENKIEYTNYYVDDEPAKAEEIVEKSGQYGVPVSEITDDQGETHYVLGFDKKKIASLIGLEE